MFDWNHVRSFIAVADAGTLSAAAEALAISQPTLGRHVDELEAATGLTLFTRGRAGMRLTEAGLSLIDEARAMSADADRLALKAAGRAATVAGTVRITASDVVATYYLPAILDRAEGRRAGDRNRARPQQRRAEPSVARCRHRGPHGASDAERHHRPQGRRHDDRRLCRPRLSRSSRPAGRLAGLAAHRLVGYDRDDLILRAMQAMGLEGDRRDFAFRTDDQVAYWELVKAGAGIGFGARYLASLTPSLEEVLPELSIPPLPVWLAAHQELRTSLRIRRVMDRLHEALERPAAVHVSGLS